MIRRALLGLFALCFAGAALGQTYQPGRAPGFRPGFSFLSAAAPGVTGSTWSPTDRTTNSTLANGNRRATVTNPGGLVRGTAASPARNAHVEFKLISTDLSGQNGLLVSLAPGQSTVDRESPGAFFTNSDTTGYRGDGTIFINGNATSGPVPQAGDVLAPDYDQTTGNIVWSRNGTVVATGTLPGKPSLFPSCGRSNTGTQTWDINTGQDTFTSNPNNVVAWP